jgi:deoxycytidylate deaminase
MESVTLYSTHCPRCQVLEKKLIKAGITYTVCDDIAFMRA